MADHAFRAHESRAADHALLLQQVTAALSSALTPEQVADVILGEGLIALGAIAGTVSLLSDDGSCQRVVRARGYPPRYVDAFRVFPMDAPLPLSDAVRRGETVLVRSEEERRARYPQLPVMGDGSLVALPLVAAGRPIGGLGLRFPASRDFPADELAFMETLCQLCAQALWRARLYDSERHARAEADEALALLDSMLDAAPLGQGFLDPDLRYVRVNRALAALNGVSVAEHLGRTVAEVIPWAAPVVVPLLRQVLETGVPLMGRELSVPRPSDPMDLRHSLVSYYPVHRHDGTLLGLGAVVVDITPRKRAEQERQLLEEQLQQRVQELAEMDRRKDEFLAMLAHELRNPLSPLSTALHLIERLSGDAGAVEKYQQVALRQVRRLTRLVDDLLDVSRITRGKIELRRERVDLGQVALRAVEATRPLLQDRQHQLDLHLPAEPLQVEADPVRLEQIVANLLNNAAKYTPAGGRIGLQAERSGDTAVLRVLDTGIGIAREMLTRIFEPFVQAERTLDRSRGGLGIGLTLVRRLAELHGGSVTAESEGPGQGSRFTLLLPALRPAAPADSASQGPGPDQDAYQRPGLRVLIVDDNTDAADTLGATLSLWGHTVRLLYEGPSAVAAAVEFRPDVVLLDIGLPGLSGYEIAEHIRAHEALRGVLLVALTGYGQEADRRRAAEAGFDHHLLKPVDLMALRQVLKLDTLQK